MLCHCHGQFALLLAKVVVVAIRFLHMGITDSHTSDVGHWFGMTGSCILRQPLFCKVPICLLTNLLYICRI